MKFSIDSTSAPRRYCLRCQGKLNAFSDSESTCAECGWQFDPFNKETFAQRQYYSAVRFWLPGVTLAVVSGIFSYAICLTAGELGFALFVAVPVSVGAIIGYSTPTNVWLSLALAIVAIPAVVLPLVSLSFAGFFCGVTLGLIFVLPIIFGSFLGFLLRTQLMTTHWDQRWFFSFLIIALPYFVQAMECTWPRRTEIATVKTELRVEATPQEAWDAIMFYEEVKHKPSWFLRLMLPAPIRSIGHGRHENDIVRCVYDRGCLVKRISRREEGKLLGFDVIEQQLHFERDITLIDGSFLIESTEDGAAKIVLTTRYERHLAPRWIWEPIEQNVVHSLHLHVLKGMQIQAEQTHLHSLENPDLSRELTYRHEE
jgi:hypothetical protein